MSANFFFQLLTCAVSTAIFLVGLESNNNTVNVTSVISFVAITIALFGLFIYCKLSENITCDLYAICDMFYESTWYRLPVDQQKWFIWPIQRGQKTIRLTGLGFIDCSLATFLSVNVQSGSFFLSSIVIWSFSLSR